MRILADMGVDTRVVEWLQQHGHDAKHLRDEGLHRMPDGEIFVEAISEDRVIMTFDFVEGQDLFGRGGTSKDATEVLFSFADVFADDHQKTNPENRALPNGGGLTIAHNSE